MIDDLYSKYSKTKKFLDKEILYKFYSQVANDIQSGIKDDGVWAKAYSDAMGDAQKQKAIYIELMVERLILSYEVEEEIRSKEQIKKDFPGPKEVAEKFKFDVDPLLYEEDDIIDKIMRAPLFWLSYLVLSLGTIAYLATNYDQHAVSGFIRLIIFISISIGSGFISFLILRLYWMLKSFISKIK